ncbi:MULTISPECIES: SDR family NAD(P)-dependent oxidoreductase [Nocardia]|uniref:SDR family NAD(P)-dependent oxidoreductase n=1 Tax=Nocardia TaxID=1817 RepID=UPI0018943318|nr:MULTISPECIES: SDR family NAD(P)-dependent oxidoreductase [Nocardia]MBF6352847.1 SDR family oxidoreductase [Nocardia flavorosea]
MTYSGKSVLITGAASGIGYATAELFARNGADIVAADIDEDGLQAATRALAAEGPGEVFAVPCDTADPDSCTHLVERAVDQLGKLDIVCNIAGVLGNGPTEDLPDATWQKVLAVNLNGPFYISKRVIPHLLETGGSIVNVASTAGLIGVPYGAAYSASKAGVIGLTKALAAEYSRRGVRVNAVCPGHVLTPMTAGGGGFGPDVDADLLGRLAPLTGKGSRPGEIAAAIAFLTADTARNTTGAVLTIDGGQTVI